MIVWFIAIAAGLALSSISYPPGRTTAPADLAAFALRALAAALLLALLFDAPRGRGQEPEPIVAIDVSASMLRGSDSAAWRRSVDSITRSPVVLAFGDSVREVDSRSLAAGDARSRVGGVVERAAIAGKAAMIVTDGEIEDPERLEELPGGSSVRIVRGAPRPDAAVVSLRAPLVAAAGDTVDLRTGIVAGEAGAAAGTLRYLLGNLVLAEQPVAAMGSYAEVTLGGRVVITGVEGEQLLHAVVSTAGDSERRNDTLTVPVTISRSSRAVYVSTSPDYDARFALGALRGSLQLAVRGFWRVAPGQWRVDGSMTPVSESDVRSAFADAPVAVLHGDTSIFGAPRSAARGSLILHPTAGLAAGDWYATSAPASPVSSTLTALPWDSLPPLRVSSESPRVAGAIPVIELRLGRRGDPRPAAMLSDEGRRVAVVAASGYWRWRFRGGASAAAFDAFWGTLFDWVAAGRPDRRSAAPDDGIQRAGEPLRWRRGGADSVVVVMVGRAEDGAGIDTMTLRFAPGENITTSPPLAAGVYRVSMPGGAALLAVNASRELIPRRPGVSEGRVGAARHASNAPQLRDSGLPFLLVVLALCAEWLLRRRRGRR
jgi:hypothetical protein